MTRRFVPLVLAGLLLAAVVWLLFSFGAGPGDVEPPRGETVVPNAAVSEEPAPEAVPEASPAREDVAAEAVAAPEETGPPERYRAALAGFRGRLVERDGTPVAGLPVELFGLDYADLTVDVGGIFGAEAPPLHLDKGSTASDDEGVFEFQGVEPSGFYALGIDLGGARADVRLLDRTPQPGEIVDLGDVVLAPFVTFTGRIVGEDGAPLAGAFVRATNLPSVLFSFGVSKWRTDYEIAYSEQGSWRVFPMPRILRHIVERFPIPTTRTDEDGRFRLAGVPVGMVTVLVEDGDRLPLVHGPVPTGAGGERDLGTLTLEDGETLAGRVVDADGAAIADAELAVGVPFELLPAALLEPVGRSDEEGRFLVRGLPDKDLVVAARPDGAAHWTVVTGVLPGSEERTIRVGRTGSLLISVTAPDGTRLSGAEIAVVPLGDLPLHPLLVRPLPLAGRLDRLEDGRLRVRDLDPGRYAVLARAKGYGTEHTDVRLSGKTTEVQVSLPAEVAAEVRVVDAVTGDPVEFALVSVFAAGPGAESRPGVALATRRSDGEGRVRFGGLRSGSFRISALHPAYAEVVENVDLPGGPFTLALHAGGVVEGVVLEGGRPPAEARFVATGREQRFPRMTVTDSEGAFRLGRLEAGHYRLVVLRRFADRPLGRILEVQSSVERFLPERFVDVDVVDGKTTQVTIDLLADDGNGPKGRVTGSVVWNGQPGSGLALLAAVPSQRRRLRSTVTDEVGRFDFGELPAGSVTVMVRAPRRAGSIGSGNVATENFELVENEKKELRFEIWTGRVQGRVVDARGGAPIAGANVRLFGEEQGEGVGRAWVPRLDTVSERDGSFLFPDVPKGTYRLQARRDDYAPTVVSGVRVPARGAALPVLLTLRRGVEVSGRVLLPEGSERPPFLFLVAFDPKTGDTVGSTSVDRETLEFHLTGVRPGELRIEVFGPPNGAEPVEIVVPQGGALGVEVPLRPKHQGGDDGEEKAGEGGG